MTSISLSLLSKLFNTAFTLRSSKTIAGIMSNKNDVIAALVARLDEAEKKIRFVKIDIAKIKIDLATALSKDEKDASDDSNPIDYYKLGKRTNNLEDSKDTVKAKKSKGDFNREGDYVVVYTDGACSKNGKSGAKAGIGVWWADGHLLNVSKPTINRNTNNAAEIQACTEACRIAHRNGVDKLLIKTDSQFVISCITQWMKKWKVNNWKTANGKDVINKDDLVDLDESVKLLKDVKYDHINGHSGVYGNEEADKLAVAGANMR